MQVWGDGSFFFFSSQDESEISFVAIYQEMYFMILVLKY
jgi:hypothetical protein